LASKTKKTSTSRSSASKGPPSRKKQSVSASASSAFGVRAKGVGKGAARASALGLSPGKTAGKRASAGSGGGADKALGRGGKKRPPRTSNAPLRARSTGRVQELSSGRSSKSESDPKRKRQTADSLEAAKAAIDAALDKKALLPVLIDVSGLASYTDFICIVSGRSDRQVDAIADGILAVMKARGRSLLGQEGSGSGRWTLLDFGDVVVHVFYHPVREFYDLESLWVDAPRIQLRIPPEAVMAQPDALYGNL
jgi:ribosome-associated protein